MDSLYLFSLIVGGFFVLMSAIGFGDHESDTDFDADADVDVDMDADIDHDIAHVGAGGGGGAGVGFIDLLSLRALFLFAAFFGFCGFMLNVLGAGSEPLTGIFSTAFGIVAGIGGNYVIKNFAYRSVSSNVTAVELKGQTAKVLLPFGSTDKGKISVSAKGQKLQLVARSLSDETSDAFKSGDEVVIVRMDGRVAEVVKPT